MCISLKLRTHRRDINEVIHIVTPSKKYLSLNILIKERSQHIIKHSNQDGANFIMDYNVGHIGYDFMHLHAKMIVWPRSAIRFAAS